MSLTEVTERTEADAALEAGERLAALAQKPQNVGGVPFLIVPAGMAPVSLEAYLPAPARLKAAVTFPDLKSFIAYVNRFKTEHSVLFAEQGGSKIQAILDYHAPEAAAWCGHTATLSLKQGDEWKEWIGKNRRSFGQTELAEFLEERELDIREPDSASILEVVKAFKVSKDVVFEKAINLDNGSVKLNYSDQTRERGSVSLPLVWTLGLRPFEHCELVPIQAKLRYRLEDGKVTFAYRLQRAEDVAEAAFRQVVSACAEGTGLLTLYGSAGR